MSNNISDEEYELEQEATLASYAARIARGHGPSEVAAGMINMLNGTERANRWRRRELAKVLHGISMRQAEMGGPDAEVARSLAMKLQEIYEANLEPESQPDAIQA
jgi:hypothetical protein